MPAWTAYLRGSFLPLLNQLIDCRGPFPSTCSEQSSTQFVPAIQLPTSTTFSLSRMESQTRWHTSGCSKPNIHVDNGVLRCLGCDSTSSDLLKQLVTQNQGTQGIIHLPAEVPLGEADLWWPECVRWRSSRPPVGNQTNTDPRRKNKKAVITSSDAHAESSYNSTIYSSPLDANHFRLIYLPGSEDVSSPIHILLEEYAFDDRPDYETVSYAWGGEDGDSTPCEPVYVGPFWDIILATKNCSALLRHLRPRRARDNRLIWLDAICINQGNNIEKSAQISRMRDIYTHCERVVAYFGEDLVQQVPGRLFRARHIFPRPITPAFSELSESASEISESTDEISESAAERSEPNVRICAEIAGISEEEFLNRRYLSRIWIVQELILSRRVILPLGRLDIHCEGAAAARLVLRAEEQRLSGEFTISLSHLLKATSHCEASDPRDRVYGLLGLYEPLDALCVPLESDYSLSWRDCWVGIGAYLVLIERRLLLLAHSVGSNHNLNLDLPSWVPNLEDAGPWTLSPPISRYKPSQHPRDYPEKGKEAQSISKWDSESESSAVDEPWATEFVMLPSHLSEYLRDQSRDQPTRYYLPGPLYPCNLDQASVDSSTGALRLQATHVFDRPCHFTIEAEDDGRLSLWAYGLSTAARFRVIGSQKPGLILEESYQVFVIDNSNLDRSPQVPVPLFNRDNSEVVLVLATASSNDNSVVALHACFEIDDIRFFSKESLAEIDSRTNLPSKNIPWPNLYHVLTYLQTSLQIYLEDRIFYFFLPNKAARRLHFVPVLIHLARLKSHQTTSPAKLIQSLSAVAESLCPDHHPLIHDNYFLLTVKDRTRLTPFWTSKWVNPILEFESQKFPNPRIEVDYSDPFVLEEANWTTVGGSQEGWMQFRDEMKFPFTFRVTLNFLVSCFQRSTLYTMVRYAQDFSELVGEDVEVMVARTPMPEDHCIFLPRWNTSLVNELGLILKPREITIR